MYYTVGTNFHDNKNDDKHTAVSFPYLWYAVDISHNFNYVIQRQQRVALQLSIDVLSFSAGSQQLHQRVVIG